MGKIKIDPEFEALIPPLAREEFEALEQSILRDGCRDALVVWNDILIDGHNRYKICRQHSKPFRTTKIERIDNREQILVWIIDNQLARRNVTAMQRTELALKKEGIIAARAKYKMEAGTNQYSCPSTNLSKGAPVHTRREVAKAAGVSEGTVAKVKKMQARAVPEIMEAARTGDIKIDVAVAIATLPKEEQVALAAKGKGAMKATAKKMRDAKKKKGALPPLSNLPIKSTSSRVISNRAPAPWEGHDEPALLRAKNADLRSRLEELSVKLARAQAEIDMMGKVLQANDPLAAALAEVKRLTDSCIALESRLVDMKVEGVALARPDVVQRDEGGPIQDQVLPDGEKAVCNATLGNAKAIAPPDAGQARTVAHPDVRTA